MRHPQARRSIHQTALPETIRSFPFHASRKTRKVMENRDEDGRQLRPLVRERRSSLTVYVRCAEGFTQRVADGVSSRHANSALCRSSEPLVVARKLCGHGGSSCLYLADLDAIQGRLLHHWRSGLRCGQCAL